MATLGWTVVCVVALATLTCLVISFVVSWRLTHNNARKPVDESPAEYGLEFEPIAFQSRDGIALRGWFIPASRPKDMTIIFAHGYRGNRLEKKLPALQLAKELSEQGFHVVMFDFRSCGESGGNVTSIGLYEQEDILGAVEWVKTNRPSTIGLIGFSMGASTALLAASRAPEVVGVVADSPFDELSAYLRDKFYIWTKLPSFLFTPLTLAFIRMHVGDPGKVNPKQSLERIYPRPVLFIHGDQDKSIPCENSLHMHESYKENSQFWNVPHADHVQSFALCSGEYTERVVQFFDESCVLAEGRTRL